jgi:hypothetical protein
LPLLKQLLRELNGPTLELASLSLLARQGFNCERGRL